MAPVPTRISLDHDTDRATRTLGHALRMGKGEKWTRADAIEAEHWASKVYMADSVAARRDVLDQFWDRMVHNLGLTREPTDYGPYARGVN